MFVLIDLQPFAKPVILFTNDNKMRVSLVQLETFRNPFHLFEANIGEAVGNVGAWVGVSVVRFVYVADLAPEYCVFMLWPFFTPSLVIDD